MNAPWWRLAAERQQGSETATRGPQGDVDTIDAPADLADLLPPFFD
ncbi:hypothetical protein [Cellulomonas sp. ICMP 17802]